MDSPFRPQGLLTRAAIVLALSMSFARLSLAQTAGNKAVAEALFDQGKLLMQTGDFPKACEKFEASRRLDEGIGTLLYLADCYEKVGKTASAWAVFKEAASIAGAQGQDSRQRLATQRAKNLETSLVKLTIDVAKGNEALLGFEVRNDGVPLSPAQFATQVPVDPGEHHVEASAPGRRTFSEAITLTRGVGHVAVPLLAELPSNTSSGPESAVPRTDTALLPASSNSAPLIPTSPPAANANRDQGKTQRVLAVVLGGVGVVSLGIGSYYGLSAIAKNSKSKDECPSDPNLCRPEGVDLRESALHRATISTVAFAIGGATLAAGAVLLLTAPSTESPRFALRSSVGHQYAQLTAEGAF
ncbi:MAG TPA: tetratricopeptide repeat protein [Polyangiaceae bacterium]